jgi:hypothetical protein
MNMFIFAGIFLMQFLIGEVIELWPVDAAGGYDREAYFTAFGCTASRL